MGVVEPVQGVPLSAKDAGTGLASPRAPTNPIEVEASVASDPFQSMLAAETPAPDWVQTALQPWVTRWSAFGKSKVSVQSDVGSPRLVTSRSALNPPGHSLRTV
nr:hypothetical protein GCM10025732_31010 [Glycomyces mayteni]